MKIDNETVDKIAHLARLEFENESKEQIIKDMNNMLAFVEKLNELDTSNIEPLIYMSDEVNVLREDEVKHEITQNEALKNSPQHDSDYFKVPKVIGKIKPEEIVETFLLNTNNLSFEKSYNQLFDFFVNLKDNPEIKFGVEVKSTNDVNYDYDIIKKELIKLRDKESIDFPVLLFNIDEKNEKSELGFIVFWSKANKYEIKRSVDRIKFKELNQDNLNKKIKTIIKWYSNLTYP